MARQNKMSIGVIGTGFIGPAHIEGLRRLGLDVKGLADVSAERARVRAGGLRLRKAYASYEEMLADPEISVVHIATPNHLHFAHSQAALQAGKHVVCEKPLAMNAGESATLAALAKAMGRVAAVNFNLRFYPMNHQAKAIVQSGGLGDVFICQGSYLQDWLLYPTDWNWRLDPALGGPMRAVADIGSHWLDLVSFITGLKIESVFADFATFLPIRKQPKQAGATFTGKDGASADSVERKIETEDYATILLKFKGGARGSVTVSQVSAGRKNRLFYEISGSKSAVAWDGEHPNDLWIGHRDRPNEMLLKDPSLMDASARQFASYPGGHAEGYPDTFKQLYAAVYRYIQNGDFAAVPDFPTFEDGHDEMLLGEAIFKSAKTRRWVKV
jgi:predicted dehydrogenase